MGWGGRAWAHPLTAALEDGPRVVDELVPGVEGPPSNDALERLRVSARLEAVF